MVVSVQLTRNHNNCILLCICVNKWFKWLFPFSLLVITKMLYSEAEDYQGKPAHYFSIKKPNNV